MDAARCPLGFSQSLLFLEICLIPINISIFINFNLSWASRQFESLPEWLWACVYTPNPSEVTPLDIAMTDDNGKFPSGSFIS